MTKCTGNASDTERADEQKQKYGQMSDKECGQILIYNPNERGPFIVRLLPLALGLIIFMKTVWRIKKN